MTGTKLYLTKRQKEFMQVVYTLEKRLGRFPQQAYIYEKLGVKELSSVPQMLKRLVERGAIEKNGHGRYQISDAWKAQFVDDEAGFLASERRHFMDEDDTGDLPRISVSESSIPQLERAAKLGSGLAQGALKMIRSGRIGLAKENPCVAWIEEAMEVLVLAQSEIGSPLSRKAIDDLLKRSPVQESKGA